MLTELGQQRTNTQKTGKLRSCLLGLTSSLFILTGASSTALADDTEIFTAGTPPAPESSNVLFLIDTSGSMWQTMANDPNGTRKINAVQNVFENLIFDVANTGNHNSVNPAMQGRKIALMRFDDGDSNGGYFLTPMLTLNNGSKDEFWTQIEQLVQFNGDTRISPTGFTPLAESAYEAARFFRGETPVYGNRTCPTPDSTNCTTPGRNHPGVTTGNGYYKSPFSNANNISQCGVNNHLVILTDGLPTEDGGADTSINALDNTTADCAFSEASNGDCLPQVAEHLYSTDLFTDIEGTQNVMTHTIAFDLSANNTALQLLRTTAELGGGIAARADNAMELADAIETILRQIQDTSVSFVNPAVSVSSSNRFVHDNTVYMGLFKPKLTPWWHGNLKGYQYNAEGELMDFSATPQPAIINGAFSPTAISKWSTAVDGGNIGEGGAAEQILTQPSRNIFTQNSANPSASTLVPFSVANENSIPAADFGDNISNDLKIELIQWATSRNELPIGDPLHSEPQIIDYGGDTGPVIFFGTNHGFLHGISASNGQELMSFIPKSLLANLRTIKDDNSQNDHPYGLDGFISYHVKDNGDKVIRAQDGDRVLIIVGMRRGGNEFYALNVTDPDSPSLQWYIKGGNGDFTDMGDSWSKPIITQMKFGNTTNPPTEVALIGGGYDNQYDELDNTISDPAGAALYAVNLANGSCVWSASDSASSGCDYHTQISGMSHSIPSHIAAIDLTSDRVADRLYAIDIMGKIFRVDLNFTDEEGNYVITGQTLADLSGGDRRYYYGVDVAYTNSTLSPKLHLSVGSGHRAHPLATASGDILASVFDFSINGPLPEGYTAVTLASLTNLTDLEAEIPGNSNGWYINLASGEKALSLASSIAGYVFFTTYTPPVIGQQNNSCEVQYGSGTVYAINLLDASPLNNERAIPVNTTGIPSSVAFITLGQPGSDDNGSTTDNPLETQDAEVFAMVNGDKISLNETAHGIINSSIEASKFYWYIGEPSEETPAP